MNHTDPENQQTSIVETQSIIRGLVEEVVQEKVRIIQNRLHHPKSILRVWLQVTPVIYMFVGLFLLLPPLVRAFTVPEAWNIVLFVIGFMILISPRGLNQLINRWMTKKRFLIGYVLEILLWYPLIISAFSTGMIFPEAGIGTTLSEIFALFITTIRYVYPIVFICTIVWGGIYLALYGVLSVFFGGTSFIFFLIQLKTYTSKNSSETLIPDAQSFIVDIVHSIMSMSENATSENAKRLPDLSTHGWQLLLDMSVQRTDGMSIRQDTFALLVTTIALVSLVSSIVDNTPDNGSCTIDNGSCIINDESSIILDWLTQFINFLYGSDMSAEETHLNWLFLCFVVGFMLFVFVNTLKIYRDSFVNEVFQKLCSDNLYRQSSEVSIKALNVGKFSIETLSIKEREERQQNDASNRQSNHSSESGLNRLAKNLSIIFLHNLNKQREVGQESINTES